LDDKESETGSPQYPSREINFLNWRGRGGRWGRGSPTKEVVKGERALGRKKC